MYRTLARRTDRRGLAAASALAVLAAMAIAASQAQGAEAQDEIRIDNGVRLACTGISEEARADPRWGDFSARIEAASVTGAYLGDVAFTVTGPAGETVVTASCPGPWLVVDLEPGAYRIEASHADQVRGAELQVDTARQDVAILHFDVPATRP